MVPSTAFNGRETTASLSGGHCGVRRRALRPATSRARAVLEIVQRTPGRNGCSRENRGTFLLSGFEPVGFVCGRSRRSLQKLN